MKRSYYGEPDYALGRSMLTLRSRIGLMQAGLAELLGASRKAVGKWGGGPARAISRIMRHLKKEET